MSWLAVWLLVSPACVAVDAGHGGSKDSGATHETLKEKNLTLDLAKKLAHALRSDGVEVVMTRESDSEHSLAERAQLAKNCAALISMHVNANLDPHLAGFETYYLDTLKNRLPTRLAELHRGASNDELIIDDLRARYLARRSGELAVLIQRQVMMRLLAIANDARSNGARHDLLELLARSEVPAVIVESGYISNPVERDRLQDSHYQAAIISGIVHAVKEFLQES